MPAEHIEPSPDAGQGNDLSKAQFRSLEGAFSGVNFERAAEVIRNILADCWSAQTSSDPEGWSPENPSWGQCAVTACLIQDIFGGEIVWAMAETPAGEQISHYFNQIEGASEVEVDFTRDQFPEGTKVPAGIPKPKEFASTREYVLSYESTRDRYLALREAFLDAMTGGLRNCWDPRQWGSPPQS